MDQNIIQKINTQTNKRYNKRLLEKGPCAYTLGWGEKKYQIKRFEDLMHTVTVEDLQNKSILDIGCGLGDLYKFLKKKKIKIKKYIGIDINPNFVNISKIDFKKRGFKHVKFNVRDILLKPYLQPIADIGIILGVLNFKRENHEEYVIDFIKKSFDSVSDILIVNLISDVHNNDYPREDFIHYYKPSKVLELAQKITPFCSLIQDYAGEPQYEFILIMRKKPWSKK